MLSRNVLIFHSAALGDFIVTWPLVMALGRMFAQSRVIVVTQAQKGALAEAALRVDCADIESGWAGIFGGGELAERPRKMLETSHAIFNFIGVPPENLARYSPRAKITTLTTKPPADCPGHATAHLLEQLADQAVIQAAMQQMINSINTRGLGGGEKGGEVVIHPGSGSSAKNWPIENFVALARRLENVRFIVGEAEIDRWPGETIAKLNATRCDSLVDLLKILRGASAYIGNDSGPTHLAGILGLPTIALFGPSDPKVWRPLGPRVNVIHKPNIEAIEVDEVYNAVRSFQ
jgi:heptosyltransferase III